MNRSSQGLHSTRQQTDRQEPPLSLFNSTNAQSRPVIPKFHFSELQTGNFLGEGEFGIVHEIQNIGLSSRFSSKRSTAQEMREYMSENVVRNRGRGGGVRYAIKQYHPEVIDDVEQEQRAKFLDAQFNAHSITSKSKHSRNSNNRSRKSGDGDDEEPQFDVLAIEAALLAVMSHPNIIKMRGIGTAHPMSLDFFIILDCLTETLEDRIHKVWKKQSKKKGFLKNVFRSSKHNASNNGEGNSNLLADQCYVVYDICSALRYLHRHNIIYRDLKPQNIGFDVRNDVKLFDFGLSRELPVEDRQDDGLYLMTGHTGSRRYMAPEVALDQPYSTSADVYSFGLIIFEISCLETPYKDMDANIHMKKVVQKGVRPKVTSPLPQSLQDLMNQCWHADPRKRPVLEDAATVIRAVADRAMDDGSSMDSKAKGDKSGTKNGSLSVGEIRSAQDELSRSEKIRRASKTSFVEAKILDAISGLDLDDDDD